MNWSNESVAVIGCGVMAQCLVDGWLKNKIFQESKMILTDSYPAGLETLKRNIKLCQISSDNSDAVLKSSIVFICVKPFMVESVLPLFLNRISLVKL